MASILRLMTTQQRPVQPPRVARSIRLGLRRFPRLRAWRAVSACLGVGLAAYLVYFHALLLWNRIATLKILETSVALRWGGAVVVLLGVFRLSRGGVPLFQGRKAVVFWLLVLLLHSSVWMPATSGFDPQLDPTVGAALLFALPIAVAVRTLVGADFRLLASIPGRRRPGYSPPVYSRLDIPPCFSLRSGFVWSLFARPPPA